MTVAIFLQWAATISKNGGGCLEKRGVVVLSERQYVLPG
jgi:hypothetical protein